MPSVEEIWEWIRTPLDHLKNDLVAEPDKPWETRRAEFLEQLGLSDPSQHPVTEQLVQNLDQLTDEDRAAAISSGQVDAEAYELAQRHAIPDESHDQAADHGQATAGEAPGYDEQAWQSYLAENGPAWDGTEENWDQYTQWFLYYAGERGLTDPATALMGYLTAQPAAERVTTFAQYGVTISPATAQTGEEPAAAQAGQSDTAATSGAELNSMMAEVLAENPELADIPEERRREIMAEVLGQSQS